MDASSEVLAGKLERLLRRAGIRERDLRQIQRQVRAPKGHEERVVEGMCRCLITEYVRDAFKLERDDLRMVVNSSHKSVRQACAIPSGHHHAPAYSVHSWKQFRKVNPAVDFYEDPVRKKGLHRADLFVVSRSGELISLEFKHVASKKVPNLKDTVEQMHRYDTHGASVLVIYAAEPVAPQLGSVVQEIRRRLPKTMRVVLTTGPKVQLGENKGTT